MTDMESLKAIGITGISLYFIKELIKIIHMQMKNKKEPAEVEMKKLSRDRILETNTRVKSMYDVITPKEKGIPVIYNMDLKNAIVELSSNIKTQTSVLRGLRKHE